MVWQAVRQEFRRAAVAYLVLAIGLALTAVAGGFVARGVAADDQTRFDRLAGQTENAISDRLNSYLDALQGARGLFDASDTVNREEWSSYIRALDLQQRYPGTRSIAYVRWVPAAEKDAFLAEMRASGIPEYAITTPGAPTAYAPLTYVEPMSESARGALGFDALADPIRRAALERARDTGQPAASESTVLANDLDQTVRQSVLLYVPVYRGGGVPGTIAERRAALQGFVLTGLRMDDLMAGLFGQQPDAPLAFAIFDGPTPAPNHLMYALEGAVRLPGNTARADQTSTIEVAGRTWTIVFTPRPAFARESDRFLPALVASGGLVISILLALLARTQALSRAQAERRYRDLFNHAPDIIYEHDLTGRYTAVNPAATHLLGYTTAELLARRTKDVVAPDHHEGLRALARRALDGAPLPPGRPRSSPRMATGYRSRSVYA
jgi:CHASE1-domain containing sensor protein